MLAGRNCLPTVLCAADSQKLHQGIVARLVSDMFARVQQQLLNEDRCDLNRLEAQLAADANALHARQAAAVEGAVMSPYACLHPDPALLLISELTHGLIP